MSLARILEILFYQIMDFFPSLILAFIPFRRNLRFGKAKSFLFLIILYFLVAFSRIAALTNQSTAAVFTVLWVILYLIFYLLFIQTAVTKLLFVLLTILNYGSVIVILSSYFFYHKLWGTSIRPYSIYATLTFGFFYFFTLPAMLFFFEKKVRPLLDFPSNNHYWDFLWLVPGTFCLSYYYNLYANGGIIAFSGSTSNVIFALFFNIGALFVTYLILKLMEESNNNLLLKEENSQLSLQTVQYENLQNRVEDARRARHDLRQNLTVIQSYLSSNNTEGLLQYINNYLKTLPPDSPIVYCSNYALNALIVYYETIAAKHSIRFQAETEYPQHSGISDSDSAVLFGNMLENALEACMRQPFTDCYIFLKIKLVHDMLVITLDNSYSGTIYQKDGEFLSSKTKSPGIGITSIRKITSKYNGIVRFEYDEHNFHVSVMLNPKAADINTQNSL